MTRTKSLIATMLAVCGLTTAASADPGVTNEWVHTLALGVTATSGNTDTKLYTASWLSEYRFLGGDLVSLGADAQNGETDGKQSADSIKGDQNFKHLISDRAYLVANVNELYDSVADISYRITPSLGIGYFLLKNDASSLGIDIGPGYRWEKLGGVTDDYAIFRASERYERRLSASSKVWQSVDYTPKVEDFDIYTVSGEIGAEAAMTKTVSLRVVFKDQYINVPAEGRERNDTQVIGALAFKI